MMLLQQFFEMQNIPRHSECSEESITKLQKYWILRLKFGAE